MKWRRYLGNLALVVAVLAGVQWWQTRGVPSGPAPDMAVSVVQADGRVVATSLAQWRAQYPGQAVAVHFWAEWCPICRTEEGSITRLGRDWPVITVAMRSGDAPRVLRHMRQRGLFWPAVVDTDGVITSSHGFQAVPAFLVVDAHGQIRTPTVGYTTELGMRLRLLWVRLFT